MQRELEGLQQFRISLLKMLLLTAAFFSVFIAALSWLRLFPLDMFYRDLLFVYGLLNLIGYWMLHRSFMRYKQIVHLTIFASLFIFSVMTYSVREDEFRLVWFFLTAFASYILAGKYYGTFITLLISSIVIYLYNTYELELSIYAVFTFLCAMVVFNAFAYAFMQKIERDEAFFQKRVEEEIKARHSQEEFLLRQYRMASMGEMIDAIAHQWRQPLMQSNMIIFNIQEEMAEADADRAYVDQKLASLVALNRHMSQTVDDFRKLLSEEKQKQKFVVTQAILEVSALMRESLEDVEVCCSPRSYEWTTYKSEFVQVMIILFSNALEVFRHRGIAAPQIVCDVDVRQGVLMITVEDNGGGIETHLIERVFDPYVTTKEHTGGTGLGLYIAQMIVQKSMYGTIGCTNTDIGAKFFIKVPYG